MAKPSRVPRLGPPHQQAAREAQERPMLLRALSLIETVAAADKGLSLSDLSAQLGVPKPTVFRLTQRLEQEGFLAREPGKRTFAAGPRLLRLGFHTLRNSGPSAERRAILEALVASLGETCNFTVPAGSQVLYLDRVETRWPLRLHLEPGSRVPLHCTASGKLFLASMKPARRKRLLDSIALTPDTPATIICRDRLEKECAMIARQGYSTDNEEFLLGLIAVAVPVVDQAGTTVAAVACHAPSARLSLREALKKLPDLTEAARRLAASLSD